MIPFLGEVQTKIPAGFTSAVFFISTKYRIQNNRQAEGFELCSKRLEAEVAMVSSLV